MDVDAVEDTILSPLFFTALQCVEEHAEMLDAFIEEGLIEKAEAELRFALCGLALAAAIAPRSASLADLENLRKRVVLDAKALASMVDARTVERQGSHEA